MTWSFARQKQSAHAFQKINEWFDSVQKDTDSGFIKELVESHGVKHELVQGIFEHMRGAAAKRFKTADGSPAEAARSSG